MEMLSWAWFALESGIFSNVIQVNSSVRTGIRSNANSETRHQTSWFDWFVRLEWSKREKARRKNSAWKRKILANSIPFHQNQGEWTQRMRSFISCIHRDLAIRQQPNWPSSQPTKNRQQLLLNYHHQGKCCAVINSCRMEEKEENHKLFDRKHFKELFFAAAVFVLKWSSYLSDPFSSSSWFVREILSSSSLPSELASWLSKQVWRFSFFQQFQ